MRLFKAIILSTLSFSAFAEYRFTGTHPYKLAFNKEGKVIASLCYDSFKRCTGSINIGEFKELSLFIQQNIWRRSDVNTDNYQTILKESEAVVKRYSLEVEKREKTVNELSKGDPKISDSLKDYLFEAKRNLSDANYAINALKERKIIVDEVLKTVKSTLSGDKVTTYAEISAYNFKDFEWRYCRSLKTQSECFQTGIQYFISDKNNDLKNKLLAKAMRSENTKLAMPQITSSGLSVALLTTDHKNYGKIEISQNAEGVPTDIGGENYNECKILQSTGKQTGSDLSCKALGKNWRYPRLGELQKNRHDLMRIIPEMNTEKFLQTSEVNEFSNPGNIHLTLCYPILYNPTKNKTMNNQNEIVRGFVFGKLPKLGASAICVCSKDC
jgi:dipeptidyl aminopeptidase/acylaminoacyl peptidase